MTPIDIIILIVVTLLLGVIIYFNIIRPKIKHESGCSKCPYCKKCTSKAECENPEIKQNKSGQETQLNKTEKDETKAKTNTKL